MTSKLRHVPALDGVRGLAILLVFLYHVQRSFLELTRLDYSQYPLIIVKYIVSMGWCGVDLFFVLSGYLITNILIEKKDQKKYFANFYMRRMLRISPIYYLALIVFFVLMSNNFKEKFSVLFEHQLWFWLYFQNWLISLKQLDVSFLGHFWSLAIEEQFYLFWPFVIYHIPNIRKGILTCVSIIVMVLIYRIYIYWTYEYGTIQNFLHFSSITRFDALVFGSLVAYLVRCELNATVRRYSWLLIAGSIISLIIIIPPYYKHSVWGNPAMQIVGYSSLGSLFAAIIFLIVDSRGDQKLKPRFNLWAKIFDLSGLRFLGKYSYGIYIYHFPIIFFSIALFRSFNIQNTYIGMVYLVWVASLTLALSMFSYRFFESYFMSLKKYF